METFSQDIQDALVKIDAEKAGILPPFLTGPEMESMLEAWHRVMNHDEVEIDPKNPRFVIHPVIYEQTEFVRLATHPVVQEAVRRVIGDFKLVGWAMVATPKNATKPTPFNEVKFHVDHIVYSDVPVEDARDTFVCVWVNFEKQSIENGPFTVAVGTHKWNIGMDFFQKRKGLTLQDFGGAEKITVFNAGPAGQTAVYSGKTWHAPTGNCSDVVRKGLNMNFVPASPLDTLKRNPFDLCALPKEAYSSLETKIEIQDYIVAHDPILAVKGDEYRKTLMTHKS